MGAEVGVSILCATDEIQTGKTDAVDALSDAGYAG